MAINPSRQQTRLTKTKAEAAKIEEGIAASTKLMESETQALEALGEENRGLNKQIDALLQAKQDALGRLTDEPAEDAEKDKALIADADANVALLTEQAVSITTAMKEKRDTIAAAAKNLARLGNSPVLATLRLQEAALVRAEAAYPSLLKRHLRRCKRFGWADARLTANKG